MQVNTPPDRVAGVYADFVHIWHTPDVFVLDFTVLANPPQLVKDEQGGQTVQASAQTVARVRVPPNQVFEIMKVLERQLTAWEQETGQRPRPQDPPEQGFPPAGQ